jgi:hypothetical protein
VSTSSKALRTYLGAQATIADARLLGVSGIALWASGAAQLNKTTAADGVRLDWTAATGTANDPNGLLVDLEIRQRHRAAGDGRRCSGPRET